MTTIEPSRRVLLMGILNVTPDSFYDGRAHWNLKNALARAQEIVEEGADILDLGGESTRPGSKPVSLKEELSRILPVLRAIRKTFPKLAISIDTRKSGVAKAALDEGAKIINDISALTFDPKMMETVLQYKPKVVLMHMKGTPQTMQSLARYQNVVAEIKRTLGFRIRTLMDAGFPKKNMIVDPGIGFGKTLLHNLEILYNVDKFRSLGLPVLIGASRKSFIGLVLGSRKKPLPPEERLEGSLAAALWAAMKGAAILRVHDVRATRRSLEVLKNILSRAKGV